MRFELFVARRYLAARRKQAFISVITVISGLGVAIGVAALVIALALITGFQEDVQGKILGATAHLMVSDLTGEGLADSGALIDKVRAVPGVVAATPVAYGTVLITGTAKSSGAAFKGVDFARESGVAPWLGKLEMGRLPGPVEAGREEILLGRELAFAIGASVADVVSLVSASGRLSPVGLFPKARRFRVAGLFATGLYEFDSSTALVSLDAAQRFLGLGDRISYIEVRLHDIFAAGRVEEALRAFVPASTYITTWMELNRSLFSALKLEKTIMFLTIALIVLVAALNIIATLILMVMEKTRDIGILMAMGATSGDIRRIFFAQGASIGVIGTALGTLLGLGWCWAANAFRLIRIPIDIYQIAFVPFRLKPLDLALIVGVTLAITFLSTLFPSHRASRVDPAVALKYE